MRVLVVYCHPVETSFHAALHQEVLKNLRAGGHEVDDCDLYAEGFDPVMSREERLGYHDVPANRTPVQGYIDRLQWAEGIVFKPWRGLPRMKANALIRCGLFGLGRSGRCSSGRYGWGRDHADGEGHSRRGVPGGLCTRPEQKRPEPSHPARSNASTRQRNAPWSN